MPAKRKAAPLQAAPNGAASELDAFARIKPLLALTSPLPSLVSSPELCPPQLLAGEHDLARDPTSLSRWLGHIRGVEESIVREQLDARTETIEDETLHELLGPRLSTAVGRRSLQRIVDVYERALVHHPRSYKLWAQYLRTRAAFVIGTPAKPFNQAATKKRRQAEAAGAEMWEWLREDQAAGGDSDRDIDYGPWTGALDPALGIDEWRALAAAYERALVCYITLFLHPSCPPALSHAHARRTFDRALRTLPNSLHERIWRLYLRWTEREDVVSEAAKKVWRRYLRVDPVPVEYYVKLLVADEDDGSGALEAAKLLLKCARDAAKGLYKSPDGKSPYQLLVEWLEIAQRYPDEVGLSLEEAEELGKRREAEKPVEEPSAPTSASNQLVAAAKAALAPKEVPEPASGPDVDPTDLTEQDVEHIVRTDGMDVYKDQAGRLWTGLATYWTKKGEFDHARALFEEGLLTVLTIRDFTLVFDSYAEFSEQYISSLMNEIADPDPDDPVDEAELDKCMADFETLMDRRPFLVNDVLLRRNPHDVQEWEKRVALHGSDDDKVDETYQQAISTINPRKATPGLHRLFIAYAKFFEEGGAAANPDDRAESDLTSARKVFEKAITIPFKRVDELAEVWCEWAELEVRNEFYDEAILVMQRATHVPKKVNISFHDETLTSQARLFKSLKLWSFYVDLQESIGTVDSTRRAYDKMLELKIANAQTIINYANFLEDNEYFEDSFRVYERGVELFTYPIAFELWNTYLVKFIKRYGGDKLERTRDLFEQALEKCPPKFAKSLYLLYGQFEEDHGLTKRAMSVYDRMTRAVEKEEMFEAYEVLAAKTTANYGLPATRAVYERAIEVLPDRPTSEMCLRFAALERKLGEIDRARAIYAHASQFCDPRNRPEFWREWNAFEIDHGSEDTFREMLRIKRAVMASFNTEQAYILSAARRPGAVAETNAEVARATGAYKGDAMADLEAQQTASRPAMEGFVAAKKATGLRRLEDEEAAPVEATVEPTNADEVALDVDED